MLQAERKMAYSGAPIDSHSRASLSIKQAGRDELVVCGKHSVSGDSQQCCHYSRGRQPRLAVSLTAADRLRDLRIDLLAQWDP
jgi:hypothetical protein